MCSSRWRPTRCSTRSILWPGGVTAPGYAGGMDANAATDGGFDHAFLQQAVKLAVDNVADGGGPFGALVVRDREIIGVGQNRVTRDHDPSAHAEVVAIRA